jgi:DNA-binding MarR family transcriptional regulator
MKSPRSAADFVDNFAPYLINQVANQWNYEFSKLLKSQKRINLSQWRVMAVIRARPSMSLTELTKHVTMDQPTVSRIVEKLVERDLVSRELKSDDRRFVSLSLTPGGMEIVERLWPTAMQFYENATSQMTETEVETLVALLRKARVSSK